MNILLQEAGGTRRVASPVSLGGPEPAVALPVPREGELRLERRGSQWWLRIGEGSPVFINGRPAAGDHALSTADVIEAGGAQLVLTLEGAEPRLALYPLRGNDTIAPLETTVMPGEEVAAGTREIEVAGEAASGPAGASVARGSGRGRTRGPMWWLGAAGLLAVAGLVAALLAIVPVPIELRPADATLRVPDALHLRLGDRLMLFPGERILEVSRKGYRSERVKLDVRRALAGSEPKRIVLALLPGELDIDTGGLAAEALIDGEPAGKLPGRISVPAGKHSLVVRAPRYLDHLQDIDVKGAGALQSLAVKLAPGWGWLELDTRPAGARIAIDGVEQGMAPLRIELDSGLRQLTVSAPGRRSWSSQIAIEPGKTLQLGKVDLSAPPPPVVIPVGAAAAAAAEAAAAKAAASSGPPPPPTPRVQSPTVGMLILLPAGKFMQGSERREQGRRSNETLREVTITAPFYLAEREVTNGQFRLFQSGHASGIAVDRTLDLDPQAVSGVSWDDAVGFCNWLSQREGLPAAYERRDGRWQLVTPRNTGYRLPTEAEWEYAARYVDGRRWRRFSWGDELPMPAATENVAGEETLSKTVTLERGAQVLPGYRDEHPVVAPVGTYSRSAMGFADLGGNVSEWMHDVYTSQLPSAPVSDPVGESREGPHVIRGANWRSASMQELRLAWRDRAAGPQQTLGFRVARSP